jgi:hypothetical protein
MEWNRNRPLGLILDEEEEEYIVINVPLQKKTALQFHKLFFDVHGADLI